MKQYVATLIVLLCVAGCGQGLSVKGKVVFDDGTPLTRGEVRFHSGNKVFSGTIQKDGTFVMQGAAPQSGLEPGTYEVAIVGTIETTTGDDGYPRTKPLIAEKFGDPKKSGFICSIKGHESVQFKVTPP